MDRTAREVIDGGAMGWRQWLIVAITVGLNALDGFDVLSISFASPGIARDWGVDQATLGWVLSMELIGMSIGSVLLGGVADKIGRRPTIFLCLAAMTTGMWFSAHADGIPTLLAWRLLTGLGIGGMLAAINAMAAEYSNGKWRNLAMSLMVIGYAIGGFLGGLVVQQLLADGTWRDVFTFGAIATAAFFPLVWFLVPESVAFLERKRPHGALAAINRTLGKLGHAPLAALADVSAQQARQSLGDIFKPALIAATVLVTLAYFAHITSFYFILKWVPKIVVDMGFAPGAAAGVLANANLGGAIGGAVFGLIALRAGVRQLTMLAMVGSFGMIVWFGSGSSSIAQLSLMVAVTGLFTNSAIAGLYLLFARIYPTHVRATGTGFAIGVGRGGAALAPVLAGYLFQAGMGLQVVAVVMACGSLLGALALWFLKEPPAD